MNKSAILLSAGTLVLGVGIGWLIKPSAEIQEELGSESNPSVQSSARLSLDDDNLRESRNLTGPATRRGKDDRVDETEQMMLEYEKQQEKQIQQMKELKLAAIDERIGKLSEELGLSETEAGELKALLVADLDKIGELSDDFMSGNLDPEGVDEYAGYIQPGLVNQRMAELLEGESKEKFLEMASRERKQSIESSALGDLAEIQGVLQLDEQQKDAIYGKIYDNRTKKYDEPNQAEVMRSAFSSMTGGVAGGFFETGLVEAMGLVAEAGMMAEQGQGAEPDANSFRSLIDERVDQSVGRFDGILREEQKLKYRRHLEERYQPILRGFFPDDE